MCSFLLFRISRLDSRDEHDRHQCGLGQPCPIRCQFSDCENYCSSRDHFHALKEGAIHLCGYESLAEPQFMTHEIPGIYTRVPTSATGRVSVKLIQFRKKYNQPLMAVTNVSILPRSALSIGNQGTVSLPPKANPRGALSQVCHQHPCSPIEPRGKTRAQRN